MASSATCRLSALLLAALLVGAAAAPSAQGQIYVDADAPGAETGASWADAYTDLQTALDNATGTDSLWVAEGVYTPASATDSLTFGGTKDGLKLFGGFDGTESTLSARDPAAHRTVLSGDVGGDDARTADGVTAAPADISGENANHVLFLNGKNTAITSSTVLDGVTITAGDANGSAIDGDDGGGLYCRGRNSGCSPTLRNVTFRGNRALFGGALFNNATNAGTASPTLLNVTFVDNEALDDGGGIYNDGGDGTASPRITNTVFARNTAPEGGALLNSTSTDGTASPTITNTVFVDNTATTGGGLHNRGTGSSSPSIINATFTNNAADRGGAIYSNSSVGTVEVTIDNTILWRNWAADSGPAVYSSGAVVTTTVDHSIIDGGSSGIATLSDALVDYLAEDNLASSFEKSTNLDADPQFEYAPLPAGDDGRFATADDGLHLIPGSPALDAGDKSLLPNDESDADGDEDTSESIAVDVTGAARIQDEDGDGTAAVSIGAYEPARDQVRTIHVDKNNGSGPYDGTTWARADTSLQNALYAATPGDQIWVAEGTYYPDHGRGILDNTRDTSFVLKDSVAVYGGFQSGDTFSGRDPNPATNGTVLSGDIDQSGDRAGNAYHVVLGQRPASLQTVLDGFTITGGNANASSSPFGGGIRLVASGDAASIQPTLRNLRLVDNYAETGAGLYGRSDAGTAIVHPLLVNVRFVRNDASSRGGGAAFVANFGAVAPVLLNAQFDQNRAPQAGAFGVVSENGGTVRPLVANTIVNANVSAPDSAAAVVRASANGIVEPVFVNTTWAQNTTSGGSTDSLSALVTVQGVQGDAEDVQVANSVLWGNGARVPAGGRTDSVTLRASVVEGGWGGPGTAIVDADPQFANPAGPDNTPGTPDDSLQVLGASPALNQGNAALLPADAGDLNQNGDSTEALPVALDERPRVQTGQVDAGAYEGAVSPSVLAPPATEVSDERAVLRGVVVPYTSSASVTFEYGPTGGTQQTVQDTTIAGTDSVAVARAVDGLSPSTEYTYRVRVSNGTRTTQRQGAFTTLAASPIEAQAGAARVGDSVAVTVSVAADVAPTDRRTLHVRKGGARSYNTLSLQPVETTSDSVRLRARVPDSLTTPRGLDYYVVLSDAQTTLTIPEGGEAAAAAQPRHLPLAFDTLTAPTAFAPRRYQMVTVPAAPDDGITAALKSAYGGAYDPAVWRLERWDAANSSYTTYASLDRLQPGDAFWLTTKEGTPPTLPAGQTIPADTTRAIPLKAGWNQIGSPFAFPVSWSTITGASDLGGTVGAPVAYADSTFQRGQTTLQPWTGYFVFSTTADTLTVPPVAASAALKRTASPARPARASWPETTSPAEKANSDRYTVRVDATTGPETSRAYLGLWADAQTAWDAFDRPQLPPLHSSLRLATVETVNGRAVPLSHNAKPPETRNGPPGQHWTLQLHNRADHDQSVTLRLHETGTRPDGYQRYVLDLDRQQRLAPGSALTLSPGERRRLKVIVGTDRYAEQQHSGIALDTYETNLRGNYPNPFREASTIEYVLGDAQLVTIEIYNVLGQRVRTLVDSRQQPGVHSLTWDGTNRYGTRVGSGVYFYRMEAGDHTETKKMMLVR